MIPVCVFAKPFIPGEVKTRLAPVLGFERAAALAAAMFSDMWRAVSSCPGVRPVLATLNCESPDIGRVQDRFPIEIPEADIWLQGDGDLGMRLERIFSRALSTAPAAIAVGADSPLLTVAHLQQALIALDTHCAVIGSCEDGGFYLLGLRKCPPQVFSGVPWSTSLTAQATKSRLEKQKFSIYELQALFDVDTPDDLARLMASLSCRPEIAPATHGILQTFISETKRHVR